MEIILIIEKTRVKSYDKADFKAWKVLLAIKPLVIL